MQPELDVQKAPRERMAQESITYIALHFLLVRARDAEKKVPSPLCRSFNQIDAEEKEDWSHPGINISITRSHTVRV